jgi:hypothetical protein
MKVGFDRRIPASNADAYDERDACAPRPAYRMGAEKFWSGCEGEVGFRFESAVHYCCANCCATVRSPRGPPHALLLAMRALAISSTQPWARAVEIGSVERYRAP